MASGVQVADECSSAFLDIKRGKVYRYLIFHIKDERQICIESFGPREKSYSDFLEVLEEIGPNECRYALFDFEYDHLCQGTSEQMKRTKLVMLSWCPDTAKIKKKMLYSSSWDALKKAFEGVGKYVQATDMSEASYDAVLEKCKATDRS